MQPLITRFAESAGQVKGCPPWFMALLLAKRQTTLNLHQHMTNYASF
jgi:hypothetical protein